jgi:hypothetical protein
MLAASFPVKFSTVLWRVLLPLAERKARKLCAAAVLVIVQKKPIALK